MKGAKSAAGNIAKHDDGDSWLDDAKALNGHDLTGKPFGIIACGGAVNALISLLQWRHQLVADYRRWWERRTRR